MTENSSPEIESETTAIPGPSSNDRLSPGLSISHVISFCAAGVLGCFFLPWINLIFVKPSGLDYAKEGNAYSLLWSIPVLSVITVLAGFATDKQGQKAVALFTGVTPFLFFAFALFDQGKDLISALEPAVYATLFLSLMMLILAPRLK